MPIILKFGGSSVATAEKMKQVAEIILAHDIKEQIIVVVSALRGVTDLLIHCASLTKSDTVQFKETLQLVVNRHHELIKQLFGETAKNQLVENILDELDKTLKSIYYLHDDNLNMIDLVTSFGEQLSAAIFSNYLDTLTRARYVDARQFMFTDNRFTKANILYEETTKAILQFFECFYEKEGPDTIAVVTGFIANTLDKHTTTLGRDGSNYTAGILAAALDAKFVEIWSDVDGVYTADPKLIQTSIVNPYLAYSEAKELSYFRAKVIRQAIVQQMIAKDIPIFIKNTFNPDVKGTQISLHTKHESTKNISIVHGFVLVILTALFPHQLSTLQIIARVLKIVNLMDINFLLVTQIYSVNDVCFVVDENDIEKVLHQLSIEFLYEFQENSIVLKKSGNQSIIALIGHGIKKNVKCIWESTYCNGKKTY